MIQEFSAYPDWKAPAEDSALVIWPQPDQILHDTVDNHRRLSAWHSPLADLRRRQRQMLKLSEDRPVIASGHQTELFHPGVWAKLAMIDAAARRLDADSFFAAVDSDAPKHLQLRWPENSLPITDDPRLTDAQWCGLLDAPSAPHVDRLKSALQNSAEQWSFAPMAMEFLDDLGQQSSRMPALSAALTTAMYRLDWSLGLRHQSIVTSRLWMNQPYLAFVHHLLANAESFAHVYNQALAEFRDAHGIDNPGRPMPDLHVSPDQCEAPFWLDDLAAQTRIRACVQRQADQWRLTVDGDAFPLSHQADSPAAERLQEFLHQHHVRLSPRALTLTLFLRLLVVDQFVHGIGGGRYEQVNDRIIQRFFGIDPPAFCVTTATLYFPAAVGRQRICIPCLAHEGHRLRHAVMGPAKMQMVDQIQGLPRRSTQRQQIFSQMHSRRAEAVRIHPSIRTWQQRMNDAVRQSAEERGMFDRELFYAIQPRERLEGLIEKYAAAFGQTQTS
ncbi:MAG: hypothetical protein ABSD28_10480 [Tepidisphaeraceae bacterium]|jgi:hypothetical protein